MKTSIMILLFVMMSITAIAQDEYRPFRIGVGLGLVAPQKRMPGYLLYLEPSLRLQKYSLGLRIETVGQPNADIGILGSYTINGQYYFNEGTTRVFGGLGFGAYTVNSAPLGSCTCEGEIMSTVYGFYPRIGIEKKHLVITLDINLVQNATQVRYSDNPSINQIPQYYQAQTSYLSLRVGWNIGVGRKKKIRS